ncbi:flavin reductase family protein [Amycolatopsis balhimycina]|uniref:flavin reductase family protein n=1 Tax=Amycolatopsis balhimycina TaxID=208443 RepID=UPI0026C9DCFD|nr:flavin reductase family protein [Amycolatopsis balhimycina]
MVRTVASTSRQFRRCVGSFPTGVCVVASAGASDPAGMTLNSFTSVSLEPLLIAVAFADGTRTGIAVAESGTFSVSVLAADQRDIAVAFARAGADFREDLVTRDGARFWVPGSVANLHCSVAETVQAGDHQLVLGHVEEFRGHPKPPLVFHSGRFKEMHDGGTEFADDFFLERFGW